MRYGVLRKFLCLFGALCPGFKSLAARFIDRGLTDIQAGSGFDDTAGIARLCSEYNPIKTSAARKEILEGPDAKFCHRAGLTAAVRVFAAALKFILYG